MRREKIHGSSSLPITSRSDHQIHSTTLGRTHCKGSMLSPTPMLYSCTVCGKEYRSAKSHARHLNSQSHAMKASQGKGPTMAGIREQKNEERTTIVKPLAVRAHGKTTFSRKPQVFRENKESEESENTSCCFVCDLKHDSIESCMIHMHKQHGFFIPDSEYLKDPEGLLTYANLKVKRDFRCMYCNDRCHSFQSLEAVRKHMIAKGHCKIRYGDDGDDEEVELEEFYDYSSSYVDENGKQMVASNDTGNNIVELGTGGAELIITRKIGAKTIVRTLGCREFLRYYRQKPRPSPTAAGALAISLASSSRYRKSMDMATAQSSEQAAVRMKVLREMNRRGVDAMRSKIGMKNNVIRKLPKNIPFC